MEPSGRLHIICERDVGLFSLIQQVIATIPWALKQSRCPIVHFGSTCAYWTPTGYAGGTTVWEYYFELLIPGHGVSTIPQKTIDIILANHPSWPPMLLDGDFIASSHFGDHPSLKGQSLNIPYGWLDPSKRLRAKTYPIIRDFIRPRDYIGKKVKIFFNDKMVGNYVVGVHARGTDAVVDDSKPFRNRSLILENYSKRIDKLLVGKPGGRIFVATDEQATLDYFVRAYGDVVLACNSIRHRAGDPAGRGPTGNLMPAYVATNRDIAARNGEELIVRVSSSAEVRLFDPQWSEPRAHGAFGGASDA